MTKKEFFNYLTEGKAAEIMVKTAEAFDVPTEDPSFKLLRLAPLGDDDVDLLIEFQGEPNNAQRGIDQAHKAREIIEAEIGATLNFVEMVPRPRRDRLTGKMVFDKVMAWFKFN